MNRQDRFRWSAYDNSQLRSARCDAFDNTQLHSPEYTLAENININSNTQNKDRNILINIVQLKIRYTFVRVLTKYITEDALG